MGDSRDQGPKEEGARQGTLNKRVVSFSGESLLHGTVSNLVHQTYLSESSAANYDVIFGHFQLLKPRRKC